MPVWPDVRPFEAVPFQWSCHRRESAGQPLTHAEWIEVDAPPHEAFVDSLLAAVEGAASIMVFSAYERTILKALALRLPHKAAQIAGVIDRLVDLLPMARRGYYAPAMRGSWSLKAILPTLPDAPAYDALDGPQNGSQAQLAYFQLVTAAIPADARPALVAGMLDYCELDTDALARFFDVLAQPAEASRWEPSGID